MNYSTKNQPSFDVVSRNKQRSSVHSDNFDVLTEIYREEINIAIWQRELEHDVKASINDFLNTNPRFHKVITLPSKNLSSAIANSLGKVSYAELNQDIAELVDMFSYLFDLKRVGFRLVALDKAMCPKFHVDKVPCRLICTYQGKATEWLPHSSVDRAKLGNGANGVADSESGLFRFGHDIQMLKSGHVALLKGESWYGNDNAGLVHRSPALSHNDNRLLLSLDFAD